MAAIAAWTWNGDTRSPADAVIEVPESDGHQPRIPPAAILILERHQVAERVDARRKACGLQRHQRDQRVHARLRQRGCRDDPAEAERLEAQILPDQRRALVRQVSLVEHQVDDVEHRVEPVRQVGAGRQVERQLPLADLPLRAHDPLRDGGVVA